MEDLKMILIGQFDSPFCRRVGIALRLYGVSFEHRPLSTFGDADELRTYNPLMRVPTLVLDDGTVLVDSHGILAHLDEMAKETPSLMPATEKDRIALRRIVGLATGLSDKAVALFYEQVLHDKPSQMFIDRCKQQITATLNVLERERSVKAADYCFEDRITHADIALGAMLDHLVACHPDLFDENRYPALQRQAEILRQLPVFQDIYQPFIPPK